MPGPWNCLRHNQAKNPWTQEKRLQKPESLFTSSARMKKKIWLILALICGAYIAFWDTIVAATATYTSPLQVWHMLVSREIRYSTVPSLITCAGSALLSRLVAIPIGCCPS